MPQIFSNFVLKSTEPNFERDNFETLYDMKKMPKDFMDVGHIVYCKANKTHYVYTGENNEKYPYNSDSGYFWPLSSVMANEINKKNSLNEFEININDIKNRVENLSGSFSNQIQDLLDNINDLNADIPKNTSQLNNDLNYLSPNYSIQISDDELSPDLILYFAIKKDGKFGWRHMSLQQLKNYLSGLSIIGSMDDDFNIRLSDELTTKNYTLVYEDEFGNILDNFEPLTSNYNM